MKEDVRKQEDARKMELSDMLSCLNLVKDMKISFDENRLDRMAAIVKFLHPEGRGNAVNARDQ
jgi:hypothetical protein